MAGDVKSSLPADFLRFAEVCNQVESTRSKLSKIEIVSNYFASLSDSDLRLASTFLSSKIFPPGGTSFRNQCRIFVDLESRFGFSQRERY